MAGVIPHGIGADPQAVRRVDDHEREVADAQGADPLADEVRVSGRVDDVELSPKPLSVQQRGMDRDLVLLLARVVVGSGRSCGDAAHAADPAAAHEHRLAEHRFAGGGVADDGEISYVRGAVINLHRGGLVEAGSARRATSTKIMCEAIPESAAGPNSMLEKGRRCGVSLGEGCGRRAIAGRGWAGVAPSARRRTRRFSFDPPISRSSQV